MGFLVCSGRGFQSWKRISELGGELQETALGRRLRRGRSWPPPFFLLFGCSIMSDSFETAWMAARQAPLSFTVSLSLLQLMSIESVMPSNHLMLCCPLLLSPSIFPSIRGFSNELALHIRWPKYWSFSFSPSNEYSGSISFRIDWFDLLAVQGTLKSRLQHHSSKASTLWCPAFLMVHLSQPYMTPRKNITLTIQTFVGKVTSLLLNLLFALLTPILFLREKSTLGDETM